MERDQGALLRRADTTTQATTPIRASRNGLFVRMAQIARPAAHNHQATGCRERRLGAAARVIPRPAYDATGRGRDHRARPRPPRSGSPGGHCSRRLHPNRWTRRSPRWTGGCSTILGRCRARRRPEAGPREPSVVVVVAPAALPFWSGHPTLTACRPRWSASWPERALCRSSPVVGAAEAEPSAWPWSSWRRCGGRRLGRRHLGRRIADLRVGGGDPGGRVAGVVRLVDLEPPPFDIVGLTRDGVLRGAVVGIDPRPRGPVPVGPVVEVARPDALATVLHAVDRVVVDRAQKAGAAVCHVAGADGGRQRIRVVRIRCDRDAFRHRRHRGPASEVDDDRHVDVVAHRVRRRDGQLERHEGAGPDGGEHSCSSTQEEPPQEQPGPASCAPHATKRCPIRPRHH